MITSDTLRLLFSDYVMDLYLPKNIPKYREHFRNISCATWAVNELLMYIIRKKEQSPIASTHEFIKMMDDFSKLNTKDGFIFSIAKYIAEDILDIFYAMKGEV